MTERDPKDGNILLVSRKWPPAVGGMETYAVELTESLKEHYDVHTLVLPGRSDGRPPAILRYSAFTIKAMIYCLRFGRRYRRAVFTDLILFPAAICHWLVAPTAQRLVVVYGLDLIYFNRSGVVPALYGVYFRLFRSTQSIFSQVVAVSRHTAALARTMRIVNTIVVNPALPGGDLTNNSVNCEAAWPEQINPSAKKILYFGRVIPRKGALWFAEAVLPRLPSEVLFIVVGRPTNPEYHQKLQNCSRTLCLDAVPAARLKAMIQCADVVVMPNVDTPESADVEGFGLAAIEATALGARLLASRIQGIADAVIDGVTGRLLESGNALAWITATVDALAESGKADPLTRSNISAATKQNYSRHAQAKAFRQIFEQHVNNPV